MKKDMQAEFKKVCEHLGEPYDAKKLDKVLSKISKDELKKRTKHDEQVVNLSKQYQTEREDFKNKHSDLIYETLTSLNPKLKEWI